MKLLMAILMVVVVFGSSIRSEKVAVLTEVNKPSMIDIQGDKLFLMDMEKVKVYSLKDFSHINSFGKKGSGPGEYSVFPTMPLRVLADKKFLMVESLNKLLFFTHEGVYKSELKKKPFLNIIRPAGNKFIGRRIIQPNDGEALSTSSVRLYDQNMKEIKELFKQDFVQQGGFPNLRLKMGKDFLLFDVCQNKIFIDESSRGPYIGVYDFEGKKLYDINVPFEKIEISSKYKKAVIDGFANDPHVLWQLSRNQITWKEFSKFFKYDFPKYFPALETMSINDNKIYVKTFKVVEGKNQYIVMDLKGKALKTMYLKPTVVKWIMSTMMGINLEIIHNDKIYFVKENDNEEWELHITNIK